MDFKEIKKKIKNALTEDGDELRDALLATVDRVEQAEDNFNAEGLAEEIEKTIREHLNKDVDEKVAEEVANAVAKKVQSIKDALQPATAKGLSAKVKNEISTAILKAANKEDIKNAVNAVLVKNAITGLTFSDVIDYAIVEAWGDADPLFSQLKKVPFTKFFYSEQELSDTDIQAKQWNSANPENIEKSVQQIEVNGKSISTDYIYKIQELAFKDLDNIERQGQSSVILRWLNEELDRQIANTILYEILFGGQNNITTFESIGAKAATDAFTVVSTLTTADGTLKNSISQIAEEIVKINRRAGDKVVLCLAPDMLLSLQKFTYAAGGTEEVRSRDYVAASLGVDEIHTYSWMGSKVVAFVPNEYWVHEEGAIETAYPVYLKNKVNYQKERNIGGAVHGLLSSVVVTVAQGE